MSRTGVSRAAMASVVAGSALLAVAAGEPAKAAPIDVFVGYADNLRPSGFFPTPWLGAANVVSESSAAQSFDAGAVRIDNNTGAAITISNFSITLAGGGTFNFWNPLVIGAGQAGIFTQTFSFNFDSSDFGAFGGLPPAGLDPTSPTDIGGCSSSAAAIAAAGFTALCNSTQPVVSFSVDGGAIQSFSDTGHILDTGQWDFVNNNVFGGDGNESINWNLIGSTANRGGTVPEPASLALLGSALVGFAAIRRRRSA